MPPITVEEQLRRHKVNASVLRTSAMEGIFLDKETLALMRQFEEGHLTRSHLSAAIDDHVHRLLAQRESSLLAGVA